MTPSPQSAEAQEREALLPCPFCAASPKVGFHGDEDGGYHYCECMACRRPEGLEAERFIGVHAESEAEAISAWNRRASLPSAAASGESVQEVAWRSMDSAPKDGTLLRLLVDFEDHATEDSPDPCPTIGANSRDNTGVDEWTFAGWNWTHDCFTQGTGTPIGWMPMLSTAPEAWLQSIIDDGYRTDDERYMAKRLLALAPAPKAASGEASVQEAEAPNFCARCGKRLGAGIHTCSLPSVQEAEADPINHPEIVAIRTALDWITTGKNSTGKELADRAYLALGRVRSMIATPAVEGLTK